MWVLGSRDDDQVSRLRVTILVFFHIGGSSSLSAIAFTVKQSIAQIIYTERKWHCSNKILMKYDGQMNAYC